MKTIICECGQQETGSSENDAMTRMESHIVNEHPDRDSKKMLKSAHKTMKDAEAMSV